MKRPIAPALALLIALLPLAARAQPTPPDEPQAPGAQPSPPPATPTEPPPSPPPATPSPYGADLPLGVVVSADLGGGAALNNGAPYGSSGVAELELTAGYEVGGGFRPEVSVLLGLAPGTYASLRFGLHFSLPDAPFYFRAALDGSTVTGTGAWRWLLLGGGFELRLTDVLGGFVEADLGVPVHTGAGVPALLRAGVSFRL